MKVDIQTETVIDRPRDVVAAFAGDPSNVCRWYVNIKSVEWQTEPGVVQVGARAAFVATFMGRRLAYTYEIAELEPGRYLKMQTTDGPFPMETSYRWEDAGKGGTHMRLRNRGDPTGFSRLLSTMMGAAIRRATIKDLALLKEILEAGKY